LGVVLLSGIGSDAYGQQTIDDYYNQGLLLYQQGRYSEAENKFQEALNATKTEKEQYYQRGVALYEQGRYKEAEQEFAKAIAMKEQESDQYYKRGLLLYHQGKYKEAQQEFNQAISTAGEGKMAPSAVSAPGTAPQPPEYFISNGDLLLIKVWQNPDLDTEAIVRPDGMVSFPLVGDVVAVGTTIQAFRETLTEKLKEYIKKPSSFHFHENDRRPESGYPGSGTQPGGLFRKWKKYDPGSDRHGRWVYGRCCRSKRYAGSRRICQTGPPASGPDQSAY
jgi:Periplasmic protein involved in polysaccharide export